MAAAHGLERGNYIVVTLHRPALVDGDLLPEVIARLGEVARDLPVVFPVHPRTQRVLDDGIKLAPWIDVIDPLGYLDFAALASQARVILTDSGGLQKEAYWYGVPCVTLRPSTEWVDTVAVGANVLVDDDPDALVAAVEAARMPDDPPRLYGDGFASRRVADALEARVPH